MKTFLTESKVSQAVLDEAANVVLACCMTAAFLMKGKGVAIDKSHFNTMLGYAKRGPTHDFTSQESASDTYDQITMLVPMSDSTRAYLSGTPDECMIDSIIEFVNYSSKFNDLE